MATKDPSGGDVLPVLPKGKAVPSGFVVEERRHGLTILANDYPDAWQELRAALEGFSLDLQEALIGGQGKSKMTQRLETSLEGKGWQQEIFETTAVIHRKLHPEIPDKKFDAATHEIDHFRAFEDDRRGVALEIEWNTKDTFFDRDLADFQRLHSLGIISVGIIITRSAALQAKLEECFLREYPARPALAEEWLLNKSPATKAKAGKLQGDVKKRLDFIAREAFNSKYGATTTHWGKLQERLDRDMGAPCPLVLIGIGAERLTDKKA